MSSRRTAKVAEAIREVVSTTILFGLKDPRVKNVTVLGVEVSPDLKYAKVYVSVMGDEKTQALSLHGLNSARGFVQSQIAEKLQLRYTPILSFVVDQGVKKSVAASALIASALRDSAPLHQPGSDAADGAESPLSTTDSDSELPEDNSPP